MMNRRDFSLTLAALVAGAAHVGAQPPEGSGPLPGRRGRGFGMGGPRGDAAGGDFFVSTLHARDEEEKRIVGVIKEMQTQSRGRFPSVPQDDGRCLRMLAEFSNAKTILEIGTSQGMSALFFCMALQKTGGKLVTYEIDPEIVKIARENFTKAGVDGIATVVEGDAHEKVKEFSGQIDLLFQDADKQGYLDYLEKLLPQIRPGGLIVSHNMTPRQADPRYIKRITEDPALETLLVTLQGGGGVSLTLKKR